MKFNIIINIISINVVIIFIIIRIIIIIIITNIPVIINCTIIIIITTTSNFIIIIITISLEFFTLFHLIRFVHQPSMHTEIRNIQQLLKLQEDHSAYFH